MPTLRSLSLIDIEVTCENVVSFLQNNRMLWREQDEPFKLVVNEQIDGISAHQPLHS